MITIFTNPRPFKGEFDRIQRNALKSWIKFGEGCQIILFEDEEKTTSKIAQELGLNCITDVKFNEFGTPLFDDALDKAKKNARFDIIANINPDIILLEDFFTTVGKVKNILNGQNFLLVGQRYDLDFNSTVEVKDDYLSKKMTDFVIEKGKLHSPAALDYLVFPKNFELNPPSFAIGRSTLDSWLVFRSRFLGAKVIDATKSILAIHQNHDFARSKKVIPERELERLRNIKLAGGFKSVGTTRDANWIFESDKLKRPKFPRRLISMLTLFYPWRVIVSIKRNIEKIKRKM